jgi:purine-cytosine permease-like protein
MPRVRVGRFAVELPRNRLVRIGLGVALVLLGGLFGWLPILGYWMVPLGLLVLASDNATIRRFNRRVGVAIVGWWKGRKARAKRDPA